MIEFYEAVKAMLPAQVRPALFSAKLSDTPVPADFPYAVLWGDGGWEFSGDGPGFPSVCAVNDSTEIRFRVTVAATSPGSLGLTVKGVRGALSGKRPAVPGWSCSKLAQAPLVDIQPDRDLTVGGLNPIYLVDEYTLTATRTE